WRNMLDELTLLGYEEADLLEVGLAIKHEDSGRIYDRFRSRLMIPIQDERGRVIAFGARALGPDDNPKYLNSPQTPLFDKSRVLFGLHDAKSTIRETGTAVIVEGYMDVIQAHQAKFTNVVAQMGTAMTETQLHLIAPRYAKKIILALDSDAAGQNATRRSLETARKALESDLSGRLSVDIRILQIPDAKDPDDLIRETPEQWRDLIDKSLSITDFVINMETQGLPSGPAMRDVSVQEREQLARRLLPLLAASESNLYVESNIQRLAQRLYLNERELLGWAKIYRSKPKKSPGRLKPPGQSGKDSSGSSRQSSSKNRPPTADVPTTYNEPPPINYDAVEPPELSDDELFDYVSNAVTRAATPDSSSSRPPESPPLASAPPGFAQHNESEAYCLRVLFRHPEAYYRVNRKFRELAGEDQRLQKGPLSALSTGDFSRSDYRRLVEMFISAVNQHEMGVLEFLAENIDPVLQQELKRLLIDEGEAIRHRLDNRLNGDYATVWQLYQPQVDPDREVLEKALRLRLLRLKRELDEYSFLLMEVQQDDPSALQIVSDVLLSKQAIQRLDVEMQQQSRYL
ncbi:MAG: toprim domain-containing protein, partial [Rhodospirillaceae bacterium]|nr:toprim domain-containing protein [Rhodospirillaceae bacterium]